MTLVAKPISDFHLVVPMVLGIISEKTSISMVVTTLTSPNHLEPKTSVACAPTPAAPMVLAMVLSERMAAIGLELSCLNFLNLVAALYPSSSLMVIYEIGVDIRVASNTEHKNDTDIAPRR